MANGDAPSQPGPSRWFKIREDELETILQLSTRRELAVVLCLLSHANSESRVAFPSCATIGTSTGIARNHVAATLRRLEEAGVIEFQGLRNRVRSYRVVSHLRDMSHAEDMSQPRESSCPAHGTRSVPPTGHRTELRTELRTDPPTPQRGEQDELGRAATPSLFPVAPEEERPEIGKTSKRRPRLSPELREYADRIASWATTEVRGRKSANQVAKIREVMADWIDSPVAGALHEPQLWTDAFTSARSWWDPKRGGICSALAVDATKLLQAKLEDQATKASADASAAELEREAQRLREQAELEAAAQRGDKDAIRKLWRQDGEESCAQ